MFKKKPSPLKMLEESLIERSRLLWAIDVKEIMIKIDQDKVNQEKIELDIVRQRIISLLKEANFDI